MRTMIVLLLFCLSASAIEVEPQNKHTKLFVASNVALYAATFLQARAAVAWASGEYIQISCKPR